MSVQRFIPAIVLGAVLGIAAGYSIYKIGGGRLDFLKWANPIYVFGGGYDVYLWAVGGVIVAGAISVMWPKIQSETLPGLRQEAMPNALW